jgi:hypothetical protein
LVKWVITMPDYCEEVVQQRVRRHVRARSFYLEQPYSLAPNALLNREEVTHNLETGVTLVFPLDTIPLTMPADLSVAFVLRDPATGEVLPGAPTMTMAEFYAAMFSFQWDAMDKYDAQARAMAPADVQD